MKRQQQIYYNNGTRRRKKRVRINKVRFTLFILCCLFILTGLGFGIKALLTDRVDFQIAMTDDLNQVKGESSYQVSLTWEPLKEDKYKYVQIIVGDKEYIVEPGVSQFELELTNPNETYDIKVKAKRKGFAISRTVDFKVKTFADNVTLEQSISNLVLKNDELTFEHEIMKNSNIDFKIKSISYQAADLVNQVFEKAKTKVLKEDDQSVTLSVTIPMQQFSDSPTVSIMMDTKVGKMLLSLPVKDMDSNISTISVDPFNVVFDQNKFALINDSLEHYNYKGHEFYAESLHFTVTSEDEITSYQLINEAGHKVIDSDYTSLGNTAIDLSNLAEGIYIVKLNELPVYVSESLKDTWYTIMRNGSANQVTLQSKNGYLSLKVEKVKQLPENVYDILIDPGHGGLDGGTVAGNLTEAEESLKISTYIATRLEDHGLKVKMTRTDDLDPAGKGNFDYGKSPFFDEGRVEQAYRYQPKYMISNHLNSFDGSLEGFEVYSSIFSNDDWSSKISEQLVAAGQNARDSEKNEYRVSVGSYKKYYTCTGSNYDSLYGCDVNKLDFLYIIRETGGSLSHAADLLMHNESYTEIPDYGAETILVEYAYLDNSKDYKEWVESWKQWGEAIVKATVDYLGIKYKK